MLSGLGKRRLIGGALVSLVITVLLSLGAIYGLNRSVRQVNMAISLAFLAPNLVKAAVEGRLPRGIGVERLRDLPTEWNQQFETLGLNAE
jgi:hypothetical protein